MAKKIHTYQKSIIYKKIVYTSMMSLIYLVGRRIPLPLVDLSKTQSVFSNNMALDFTSYITGGNMSQSSIFSLGLGPWMTTMIIWGFISMSERLNINKMPEKKVQLWQNFLIFVIALVQALGVVSMTRFDESVAFSENYLNIWIVTIFVMAGSFLLMFLANLNTVHGIGAMSPIILVGMISSMPARIISSMQDLPKELMWILIVIGVLTLFGMVMTIMFELAEIRLPLERIMIHNDFLEKSYIPLKLNSAGGMPFIFATSIFSLPQLLVSALNIWFPENTWIASFVAQLNLTNIIGIMLYAVIISYLTMGFSNMSIQPEKLAKNLRKNGDYIPNVKPGKETLRYIKRHVNQIVKISIVFMLIIAVWPLLFGLFFEIGQGLLTLPGSVVILISMFFNMFNQYSAMKMLNRYKPIMNS